MGDFIVIILLIAIIGGASFKIYLNKKNNVICSGCPSCPSNLSCSKSEIKGDRVITEPIVFLKKN